MIGSYRIIHISDLHFGKNHAKTNSSSSQLKGSIARLVNTPISDLILDQLPPLKRDRSNTITICSGDLASYDQKDDFSYASRFLNKLFTKKNIPSAQILLVPGNHDVYWQDYSRRDELKMLALFQRRFRKFPNPLRKVDGPCYYFPKHRLLVYLLNSCLLCGAREEIPELKELMQGLSSGKSRRKQKLVNKLVQIDPGFIGRNQLRMIQTNTQKVLSRIDDGERKLLLRIAVLHHHVNPLFQELKRFASVVDSAALKQLLWEQGFHIILHGHKHYPHYCHDTTFTDRSDGKLTVLSCGTMGGQPLKGHYYSFNVLDVKNYVSKKGRVSVKRIEYVDDGLRKSPPAKPWILDFKDHAAKTSDGSVVSLMKALSSDLTFSFTKTMFDLHRIYKYYNPVEVKRYDVKYCIRPDYSSGIGSHAAHHVIRFFNRNISPLKQFLISLAGSSSVDYNQLGVSANYKIGRVGWQRFGEPTIYSDRGYIKIVGFHFLGRGLLPGKSATIDVQYDWPNTVEFPRSEWGIENWLFRYGIQTLSLECSIEGDGKISRAQVYSVEYDEDQAVYEGRQVENICVSRSGLKVRWEDSLNGKTQTLHSIRITLRR